MKIKKILIISCIALMLISAFSTIVSSENANSDRKIRIDNIRSFLDNSCSKLYCVLPSNAIVGQPTKITIQAWDWAERICKRQFESLISFSSTDEEAQLPDDFSFTKNDAGVKTIENSVTFHTSGIHYIKVFDNKNNIWIASNPIIVTEEEPEYKWYWGELHSHSANSDGSGTLDTDYTYAKDVSMLDFCAFTDHDCCWGIKTQSLYMKLFGWKNAKSTVNKFNNPGNFVTLLAYEYSNSIGDGHYNVYFDTVNDAPFFSCLDKKCDMVVELWSLLKNWKTESGKDVITMPHHLIDCDKTWNSSNYNPELFPLIEIFQFRGSSEMLNDLGNPVPYRMKQTNESGHSVQDALAMGYKVGFCAGSDDHTGHPGHVPYIRAYLTEQESYFGPIRRLPRFGYGNIFRPILGIQQKLYYLLDIFFSDDFIPETLYPNGGITGVFAKNLTRENIFNSLKDRKCVAVTNCNRMIADFSINGQGVGDGSEIYVNSINAIRVINCSIAGTAPIINITVVKNNKTFYVEQGKGEDPHNFSNYKLNFSIIDSEPITGISWDEERGTNGRDFYYIRALQTNNWAGWIGPIWVNPNGIK